MAISMKNLVAIATGDSFNGFDGNIDFGKNNGLFRRFVREAKKEVSENMQVRRVDEKKFLHIGKGGRFAFAGNVYISEDVCAFDLSTLKSYDFPLYIEYKPTDEGEGRSRYTATKVLSGPAAKKALTDYDDKVLDSAANASNVARDTEQYKAFCDEVEKLIGEDERVVALALLAVNVDWFAIETSAGRNTGALVARDILAKACKGKRLLFTQFCVAKPTSLIDAVGLIKKFSGVGANASSDEATGSEHVAEAPAKKSKKE